MSAGALGGSYRFTFSGGQDHLGYQFLPPEIHVFRPVRELAGVYHDVYVLERLPGVLLGLCEFMFLKGPLGFVSFFVLCWFVFLCYLEYLRLFSKLV